MNLEDINNLDINNIGNWPWAAKIVIIILACVGVEFAVYKGVLEAQAETLEVAQQKEVKLKDTLRVKHAKAVNLNAYRRQMKEMEESFGTLLRQLPDKTEVADLLVDISQSGLAAGLEFELFRPEEERKEEFYAELPIKIRVRGTYHEFGNFISSIANLPRIVTVHDFTIAVVQGEKTSELVMDTTAKTYRYLDENEIGNRK